MSEEYQQFSESVLRSDLGKEETLGRADLPGPIRWRADSETWASPAVVRDSSVVPVHLHYIVKNLLPLHVGFMPERIKLFTFRSCSTQFDLYFISIGYGNSNQAVEP